MSEVIPVILCGGSGSRLWPLSRAAYPKQLLPLATDEDSMLAATLARCSQLGIEQAPIVICNESHRFLVGEQVRAASGTATVVLEPQGRNTAPAVGVAAHLAREVSEDSILLVMPADHVISNLDALSAALRVAAAAALDGRLVTFGIVPESPETGYGYIPCRRRR